METHLTSLPFAVGVTSPRGDKAITLACFPSQFVWIIIALDLFQRCLNQLFLLPSLCHHRMQFLLALLIDVALRFGG